MVNQLKPMTQTNNSISIVWTQLAYVLPTVLVAIAALIVCVVNWQKAPTAAMFCLIGFGLIGLNSITGAFLTSLMIRSSGGPGNVGEFWLIINAARVLLNLAGFIFLLIAVFSGRQPVAKKNLFETVSNTQPNP
jgi:hypothetical protein